MGGIDDTITAVSTASGSGAEAVIRLSGDRSLEIIGGIFRPAPSGDDPSETFAVIEGSVGLGGDDSRVPATLYVMRSPATYTRQDIVELHLPCCLPLLQDILHETIKSGARMAQPGEFTRRAFLNGRIDINQAEAVLDIINSLHQSERSQALMQLRGFASESIGALHAKIMETISLLELSIDFSDQDIEIAPPEKIRTMLADLLDRIEDINRRGKNLVPPRGHSVALHGPANAGKSTLFNALAGKEHAIVSHVPGTTRDFLEATVDVEGFRFRLIDTAGLKEADDFIEEQALEQARLHTESASIRLLVLDVSEPVAKIAYSLPAPHIVVLNKIDTLPAAPTVLDGIRSKIRKAFAESAVIAVCAESGKGLDALERELVRTVSRARYCPAEFLPNIRQRHALESAAAGVRSAIEEVARGEGEEIVAFELRQAADSLAGVTGRIEPQDVLDEIFGRFCIGK